MPAAVAHAPASALQRRAAREKPAALILSGFFLGSRLGRRELGASAVMAGSPSKDEK
ncbi:hypothetical protein [Streptomyces coelicoflavus]|uniref:hypothetical protein n=1 Tax=Streptomyces coelicoflavus TaxID=285562 RepID=UPI002E26CD74